MDDEIRDAERELDNLTPRLGRMGSSESVSKRNGMEARYGQAYQRLVRLGARQQIRGKYRGVA